jgi:hypothetical protein
MPPYFSSKKAYSQQISLVPNTNNMATTNDRPFEDVSVMIRKIVGLIGFDADLNADSPPPSRIHQVLAALTLESRGSIACY